MILCGIDPGYDRTGYAFLSYDKNKVNVLSYGLITTSKENSFDDRLLELGTDLNNLFARTKPDILFMEKLFMGRNTTTVLPVAETRGMMRYLAVLQGISLAEIAPKTVKKNVTGYGNADKSQMVRAVTLLLKLNAPPKPDDVADALAIAFSGYLTL